MSADNEGANPQANSPPDASPLANDAPQPAGSPPAQVAPEGASSDKVPTPGDSSSASQDAPVAASDVAPPDAAPSTDDTVATDAPQATDTTYSDKAQVDLLMLLPPSGRADAGMGDEAPPASATTVEAAVIEKVRAVFVPPPDYLQQHEAIESERRLWVISGPPQSGRFTCAIQLGLALLGQGRPLDHELYGDSEGRFAAGNLFDIYQPGLTLLRQRLEAPPDAGVDEYEWEDFRDEVQRLEGQLADNLRPGFDNENLRSDRYHMLGILNQYAIRLFGASFRTICRWPDHYGAPTRAAQPFFRLIPAPALIGRSVGDLIRTDQPRPGTIYLCEHAFESGVRRADLDDQLLTILTETDCYLLLTTEGRRQVAAIGKYNHVSTYIYRTGGVNQRFLSAVLESHLDYYEIDGQLTIDLREKVEQLSNRLLHEALRRPFTIDLFCNGLRDLSSAAQDDEIRALADRVGDISPSAARPWFQSLTPNVRLYALLVSIFAGADRQHIEELYARSVAFLRQDGVAGLGDPRDLSLTELRNQARVRVTAGGGLQFNHAALSDEVQVQLANYHPALWSICEQILMPLIVEEGGLSAPSRPILGAAIGQVGLYHLRKLDLLLDILADHKQAAVSTTAGHVLDGVVRADPSRAIWVADKLWGWARSRIPFRMWTASVSIWRVYEGIATLGPDSLPRVRASLTELATNPHQFDKSILTALEQRAEAEFAGRGTSAQRRSFIRTELQHLEEEQTNILTYALTQIARHAVADVVELVSAWLKDSPNSKQHWVGTLAALRLMEVPNSVGPPPLLVERHAPLLALISPMLDTDVRALRVLLGTLHRWALADGWDTRVAAALLAGSAQVPWSQRRELTSLIGELWADAETRVLAIARHIIARSYLLDGWPADAVGDPAVVVVERIGLPKTQRLLGERLARRLVAQLGAVAPVVIADLGVVRHSATSQDLVVPPRLVLPVLEVAGGLAASVAVVLVRNKVLDLEDLGQGRLANQVVYGALEPDQLSLPGVTVVEIPPRTAAGPAAQLLADSGKRLFAQGMAKRDLTTWWGRIAPLVGQDKPKARAILDCLTTWVADLVEVPLVPEDDPLRKFVATVCWLSAADLKGCVDRLIIWMRQESDHFRLASGAAARALFRLFGSAEPPPPVTTHAELLRLVAPLATQGWPSVEAVLFAAQRWASDEGWANRLLTRPDGVTAELYYLIDSVDPDDRPRLIDLLAAWSYTDDSDSVAPHVVVGEALALHIARSPKGTLSSPEGGQSYGLIVLPPTPEQEQVDLVREVVRELLTHHADSIQPVIFQQGQVVPLACPRSKSDLDSVTFPRSSSPPRLLGPLLARVSPAEVCFVMVVGQVSALDEEDWFTGPWASRIVLYRDNVARDVPLDTITSVPSGAEGAQALAAKLARIGQSL